MDCNTEAMMKTYTPLQYIDAIARAGSIRNAAETLAITSTVLNRRVLALEQELGEQIFERLPRGVRLSTAGKLLIHHIRHQISDFEKLKSQIADPAGERRGHVAIACSHALLPYFMPQQIARYRVAHPAVTFWLHLRDRAAAEQALVDSAADIALMFEPVRLSELHVLATVRQSVHGVMGADHPLARKASVRLGDCAAWPVGLPTFNYGVRHLIEMALRRSSVTLDMVAESDSFEFLRHLSAHEEIVTFQSAVGLPLGCGGRQHRVAPAVWARCAGGAALSVPVEGACLAFGGGQVRGAGGTGVAVAVRGACLIFRGIGAITR